MATAAIQSRFPRQLFLLGAVLAIAASAPLHSQTSGPRLMFTDIESGPGTGGQSNLGPFISIYGEGLGASQGSSTVTFGGQPVASVTSWGQDNAARGLDRVVVQPGPGAASGNIVVTVNGQASNGLPFTVRAGNIYFVNPAAGSDGNPGTYAQPWATVWRPRQTMVAGDIVYVIGGTITQLDPAMPGWDTVLFLDASLGSSGTASAPIAYLGYPGNPPFFENVAARRGIYLNQDSGPLSYIVIGNMRFGLMREALLVIGVGQRIVGNDLSNGGEGDKIGVFGNTSAIEILGNRLDSNGTPTSKFYSIYVQGFGVNRDVEVGWNEIRNQQGGRSMQVYGHLAGDIVDDLRIHDNVMVGCELNNIVLGGSDGGTEILGTVTVTGNIIAGSRSTEGLRVNDPQGTVVIENNTLYGNAVAQVYLEDAGVGRITLRDNIVVAQAGQQYYEFDAGSSSGSFVPANNLVYGAGPCAAWDTGCINQDPLFAAASDYHLLSGSPAIDAGVTTSASRDHDGIPRPQGAAYDIGAYEWGTSTSVPAAYLCGEGLGAPNENRVRLFGAGGASAGVDFLAYGAGQWGVNVSAGPIDATATDEIVTGPGPGAVFGPHVRGFTSSGATIAKVSFYAYGTLKYGVNVGTERIDADAFDEILTGPGSGQVFGPHVRAFNYDGVSVTSIPKVSFFAYSTLRYGVNVEGGRIDADAYGEILTAPGPGPMFGPQVRGFDYDGSSVSAIAKVSFNAFSTTQYGATVASGDADLDSFAEIAASPGPGSSLASQFLGFNYDGTTIAALPGFDVTPYATNYGGRVSLGSVPQDGRDDLVTGAGPGPAADSTVRAFRYTGAALTPNPTFLAFSGTAYGVNATAGDLD